MTPHIHAKEIHAFADGYEIESAMHLIRPVLADLSPSWHTGYKYRIKPQPKPAIVRTAKVEFCVVNGYVYFEELVGAGATINLTFNGKTGEFLSSEKI